MEGKGRGGVRRCLKLVSGSGKREESMRLKSSKDVEPIGPPERNLDLKGCWWEGNGRTLMFSVPLVQLVI